MRIRVLALAAVLALGLGAATVPLAPENGTPPLTEAQIQAADLKAQQSMALSAHSMLVPTYLQMVFGLAGTLGLFATIWITLRSLRLTRESLALARQGMDEQRAATERQFRPYVTAKVVRYFHQDGEQKARVLVRFANHGATPARDLVASASVLFVESDDEISIDENNTLGPLNIGDSGEEEANVWAADMLPIEDYIRIAPGDRPIEPGEIAMVVVGVARYRDVFGGQHETRFGVRVGALTTGCVILPAYNSAT